MVFTPVALKLTDILNFFLSDTKQKAMLEIKRKINDYINAR